LQIPSGQTGTQTLRRQGGSTSGNEISASRVYGQMDKIS
jgi:hypothetical protein